MCPINGPLFKSYQVVVFPRGRFWSHYDFCYTPTIFQLNRLSNCVPRMYADDTHLTYTGGNADNIQYQFKMRFYCFTQLTSSDCKARRKCAATAQNYQERLKNGEQGWRSDADSVHRTPIWPGFDSGPLSYLDWVCCLFWSCSKGVSLATLISLRTLHHKYLPKITPKIISHGKSRI